MRSEGSLSVYAATRLVYLEQRTITSSPVTQLSDESIEPVEVEKGEALKGDEERF